MRWIPVLALVACGGQAKVGAVSPLRNACNGGEVWDGKACVATAGATKKIEEGKAALAETNVEGATAAFDAAEKAGPLDHRSNVTLWEQRGIAAAYVEDEPRAAAAFDMMLALDPGHLLSYTLSPKATFVFEKVRRAERAIPAIDVSWPRGGKVGEPVPLDVEVLADPKRFLHRGTVFVRTHGETTWRTADVTLAPGDRRVVLPPIEAKKPVSLELYVRAYDEHGNEVLTWADAGKPREIPLRYDPPTPWYRTWWGLSVIGSVTAIAVGVTVYELTIAPPDTIDGGVSVKQ